MKIEDIIKQLRDNELEVLKDIVDVRTERQTYETESGEKTRIVTVRRTLGEIAPTSFMQFCEALIANTSVQRIDVSNSKLDKIYRDHRSQQLVETLVTRAQPIESLNLSNNQITKLNFPEWEALLAKNLISRLDISNNKLINGEIDALLQGITQSESLQALNLSQNKLGNDGLIALAKAMHGKMQLQSVDISRNKFDNAAAEYFLEAASSLRLKHIGIQRRTLIASSRQRQLEGEATRIAASALSPMEEFRQKVLLVCCIFQQANVNNSPSFAGPLRGFPKDNLINIFVMLSKMLNPIAENDHRKKRREIRKLTERVLDANALFKNRYNDHKVYQREVIALTDVKPKVKYDYVVTRSGRLLLAKQSKKLGQGGHLDLAQGKAVRAAGVVTFTKKRDIKELDNASGHYLPTGYNAKFAATQAFWKRGFDVRKKYVEKEWHPDESSKAGGKWVPKP
jgi:Leucine Rich repeat